jgi:hypothetical protein
VVGVSVLVHRDSVAIRKVELSVLQRNFDNLYLAEHLVLLCSLVYVWFGSSGPWKQVYAQLLGASLLYALSSIAGSIAITRNEYYTGSVFDIPLGAAELWFCIVPIRGRELGTKAEENALPLFPQMPSTIQQLG